MRGTLKGIVAGLAGVAIGLAMAVPTMADDAELPVGTLENPATFGVTKNLVVPVGTEVPNYNFNFAFEKVSWDGDASDEAKATMPLPSSLSIGYPQSSNAHSTTEDGITTWTYTDEDALTPLATAIAWPSTGEFTYRLSEEWPVPTDDQSSEYFWAQYLSAAQYEVTFNVVNDGDGYYAKTIRITVAIRDSADQAVGDKVETPVFTSSYSKTYKDNTLTISKEVTGDMGDLTLEFPFDVTVTASKIIGAPKTYTAYKVDSDGVRSDEAITFTSGEAKEITLKHGEELVFVNTLVGTLVDVTEVANDSYNVAIEENLSADEPTNLACDAGEDCMATDASGAALYTADRADNTIAFTNQHVGVIPNTGIAMDNLPYIVLIALALAGLAAFVVIGSRRHSKANA
ncbi:MAG: hypothetical protein LBV30_02755 [Propionibacteriaceae bacterium]|nr:hypothetical protein [Propionibacteriaceae bacterium]